MRSTHTTERDVLIIGSGLAGLSCAIYLAESNPKISILVTTKNEPSDSNTKFAQGGISAVSNFKKDSFLKHIEDTLKAGDGECDRLVVESVVNLMPAALEDMMRWGVVFDQNEDGKLNLALEGGHSEKRVVHVSDRTGLAIESTLLNRLSTFKNVEIGSNLFAMDLVQSKLRKGATSKCCGARIYHKSSGETSIVLAKATVIATGGTGQVFARTTNPKGATGDGIALAKRANAEVSKMHWLQFHPTSLKSKFSGEYFMISEAVRGAGAYLLNEQGERFMLKLHPMAELAPRDVVARGIENECLTTNGQVYLDCRHIPSEKFRLAFPTIVHKCTSFGYNPSLDLIPVVTAAHYLCGGINVDLYGRTSIDGLLACGECSYTGLHGANRLASNSLSEAIVYAKKSADSAIKIIQEWNSFDPNLETLDYSIEKYDGQKVQDILVKLKQIMQKSANVFRTTPQMEMGIKSLYVLRNEFYTLIENVKRDDVLGEIINLLDVAEMILEEALAEKQNKGTHFNQTLV